LAFFLFPPGVISQSIPPPFRPVIMAAAGTVPVEFPGQELEK